MVSQYSHNPKAPKHGIFPQNSSVQLQRSQPIQTLDGRQEERCQDLGAGQPTWVTRIQSCPDHPRQ